MTEAPPEKPDERRRPLAELNLLAEVNLLAEPGPARSGRSWRLPLPTFQRDKSRPKES